MRTALLLSAALLPAITAPPAATSTTWPFWEHYAAHFIRPDGRVLDPERNQMTTSEGQSYALFFALVANDRPAFQRLLSWTEDNLAQGNLAKSLPAWSWGQHDGEWTVMDTNSASDADLWIAYSLAEAGVLWNNSGYSKRSSALFAHIAQAEVANVPRIGPVLLPGPQGFQQGHDEWVLNPGYSPLPLLLAAYHFAPQGPWADMARALPGWLRLASPAGFAMDWVVCGSHGCSPASAPADAALGPRGSYDAIRVYLWAGMTPAETPGAATLLATFAPMLAYTKAHALPPEAVAADGRVLSPEAPEGFQAALIPFALTARQDSLAAELENNVRADFSLSTGLLGSPPRYYDQNLALFALGWQEHRFRFAPDGTLKVPWTN